jgi:hypothetical protein
MEKEGVVVALNNYFTFSDWKGAVDSAKCCIAKKQASQVSREINLMGRCADTENEISFLQSSLILLQNYTYSGEFNQITDAECLQLIQRINTICNCGDNDTYIVEDVCSFTEICISGTYTELGGDSVNLVPQTVYPDLNCVSIFDLFYPITDKQIILSKNGANWQMTNDGDVLDSRATINGAYDFSIGLFTYNVIVSIGTCVVVE